MPLFHVIAVALTAAAPDASPGVTLNAYLDQVSGYLTRSVGGEESERDAARAELAMLGISPRAMSRDLARFTRSAGRHGAVTSVRMTSLEVDATLWYGVVPVRDVKLVLWPSPDGFRLLRMTPYNLPMDPFKRRAAAAWSGPVGTAVGSIVGSMLRTTTSGACNEIPLVTQRDYAKVLPPDKQAAKKTVDKLESFRAKVHDVCKQLSGTPWHRVTWRLGDMGGVVTTDREAKMTFRVSLVPSEEGVVKLHGLRQPVAPRR